MFVVYSNSNTVLVTTKKREPKFLRERECAGVCFADFKRKEVKDSHVMIELIVKAKMTAC